MLSVVMLSVVAPETNTLAYYEKSYRMAVKSLIILALVT
jgi:hypothetical protein